MSLVSSGTLPEIPEKIFLTKQKLIKRLSREPTNEELARELGITTFKLELDLKPKEYTQNSRSPSHVNPTKYYGTLYTPPPMKVALFDNPNRYDEGGRKRIHKKRKFNKKSIKSKKLRKSMIKNRKSMKRK
jgi:hypothetical protein